MLVLRTCRSTLSSVSLLFLSFSVSIHLFFFFFFFLDNPLDKRYNPSLLSFLKPRATDVALLHQNFHKNKILLYEMDAFFFFSEKRVVYAKSRDPAVHSAYFQIFPGKKICSFSQDKTKQSSSSFSNPSNQKEFRSISQSKTNPTSACLFQISISFACLVQIDKC